MLKEMSNPDGRKLYCVPNDPAQEDLVFAKTKALEIAKSVSQYCYKSSQCIVYAIDIRSGPYLQ